jgi:hypothetical protein
MSPEAWTLRRRTALGPVAAPDGGPRGEPEAGARPGVETDPKPDRIAPVGVHVGGPRDRILTGVWFAGRMPRGSEGGISNFPLATRTMGRRGIDRLCRRPVNDSHTGMGHGRFWAWEHSLRNGGRLPRSKPPAFSGRCDRRWERRGVGLLDGLASCVAYVVGPTGSVPVAEFVTPKRIRVPSGRRVWRQARCDGLVDDAHGSQKLTVLSVPKPISMRPGNWCLSSREAIAAPSPTPRCRVSATTSRSPVRGRGARSGRRSTRPIPGTR